MNKQKVYEVTLATIRTVVGVAALTISALIYQNALGCSDNRVSCDVKCVSEKADRSFRD